MERNLQSFAVVPAPAGGYQTPESSLSSTSFWLSFQLSRNANRSLPASAIVGAGRARSARPGGSGGRGEAREAVARRHAAVARQRREHLHQASARLVRDYDAIAVEKLNVKSLAGSALAKDVHDASWARLISMLRYKAEKAGARLIEVDPHNTSQDCSGCGMKVPKDLSDRRHECPHCGLSIDRDLNAARNIFNRAGVGPSLRNVAGFGGTRAGENLRLALRRRQEAVTLN